MIYRLATLIALLLVAALPRPGRADPVHIEPGAPGIILSDAWTRPSSAGHTAAGYLRIGNTGTVRDRLIRAENHEAARAALTASPGRGHAPGRPTRPSGSGASCCRCSRTR